MRHPLADDVLVRVLALRRRRPHLAGRLEPEAQGGVAAMIDPGFVAVPDQRPVAGMRPAGPPFHQHPSAVPGPRFGAERRAVQRPQRQADVRVGVGWVVVVDGDVCHHSVPRELLAGEAPNQRHLRVHRELHRQRHPDLPRHLGVLTPLAGLDPVP